MREKTLPVSGLFIDGLFFEGSIRPERPQRRVDCNRPSYFQRQSILQRVNRRGRLIQQQSN